MSVIDRIMELEAEKQKLLAEAKREALITAQKAIADLNNLGFQYKLVEGDSEEPTPRTRRSGVREEVLATIKKHKDGMTRSQVLDALHATDTKTQQSISNALANLKKKGQLNHTDDGLYRAV